MAAAILPLLLALSATAFVVIMGWLFFQFSKPGARLVPALVIAAGITLGAILFLVKLKAFALVAVVALVTVGFILAATSEEQSNPESSSNEGRNEERGTS